MANPSFNPPPPPVSLLFAFSLSIELSSAHKTHISLRPSTHHWQHYHPRAFFSICFPERQPATEIMSRDFDVFMCWHLVAFSLTTGVALLLSVYNKTHQNSSSSGSGHAATGWHTCCVRYQLAHLDSKVRTRIMTCDFQSQQICSLVFFLAAAASSDPSVLNKYHAGFNECANEVSRYLGNVEGMDVEQRARLLNHLANSITSVSSSSSSPPPTQPSSSTSSSPLTSQGLLGAASPPGTCATSHNITTAHVRPIQVQPVATNNVSTSLSINTLPVTIAPKSEPTPLELNNNNTLLSPTLGQTPISQPQPPRVLSGVQMVPTKLSTGEVAFVIPGNILTSGQIPSYIIPVYAGAATGSQVATPTAAQGAVVPLTPDHPAPQPSLKCMAPAAVALPSQQQQPQGILAAPPAPIMVLPTTPLRPTPSTSGSGGNMLLPHLQPAPQQVRQLQPPPQQIFKEEDVWRPWWGRHLSLSKCTVLWETPYGACNWNSSWNYS